MFSKESNLIFSTKLIHRFVELGLSETMANKVACLIIPKKIIHKTIITSCSDPFYLDQIILPKKNEIEKIAKECWGQDLNLEIETEKNLAKNIKKKRSTPYKKETETLFPNFIIQENKFELKNKPNETKLEEIQIKENDSSRSLEIDFSFNTFVRCESNLAAYSACESVAINPGNISNPLFIYGSTGLGKTHLLHAVGNEILSKKSSSKILYVSSNDFVNDVIHRGIKAGRMEEVRKKYNACDVLLVDDIQFLENKDACQLEFFHTFNELYQRKKQIVITSDKFPKDIPNIEDRLKSRFLQGLLVDIEPPGFEDRVAIIESKSAQLGLNIKQEISFLIATYAKTNVREIEGLLKDLLISKHMIGQNPTQESVLQILKKRFPSNIVENNIDISFIQKIVSIHFQIKFSELMGSSRQKKLVTARHTAMFLSKEILGLQVTEIAESFGKKDHTTVIHAVTKIKELIELDQEFHGHLIQIKKKLNRS